eukprot:m.62494 g.62494  ORF g.62494 m.62494 type:complete len:264 (+) comp11510_c0_seq2:112-903(+)
MGMEKCEKSGDADSASSDWLAQVGKLLDSNVRWVRGALTGTVVIAGAGICYYLYTVFRVFPGWTRFDRIEDIPQSYYDHKAKLPVNVLRVDKDSNELVVGHNPLFRRKSDGLTTSELTVSLYGVDYNSVTQPEDIKACNVWLQSNVLERPAVITLLSLRKHENSPHSIVGIMEARCAQDPWWKRLRRQSVAQRMCEQGLVLSQPEPNLQIKYMAELDALARMVEKAKRQKRGLWKVPAQSSSQTHAISGLSHRISKWFRFLRK